jgi:hypothetical protein
MIELSVVRDLVAIFGVIAGLTYYVFVVRNAGISRKTQVVLDLRNTLYSFETNRKIVELLSMTWEDFEDFQRKYDSTVNPDNFAKRWMVFMRFEGMGYMLHLGLVDIDTIFNLIGSYVILQLWQKYEPIIKEQRKFYNEPHWYRWWEYLASEISKKRVELGLPENITDTDVYTQEY